MSQGPDPCHIICEAEVCRESNKIENLQNAIYHLVSKCRVVLRHDFKGKSAGKAYGWNEREQFCAYTYYKRPSVPVGN